jgi:hypothetical protein
MQELKWPYHCSAKTGRFQVVLPRLKELVTEVGEWAALRNSESGEMALYYYSPEKEIGKKLLISTAMLVDRTKRLKEGQKPGWDAYRYMFDGADKFNKRVTPIMFPYRHAHWTDHLSDIYLTHALLNAYAVYVDRFVSAKTMGEPYTHRKFALCVATELFKWATEKHSRLVKDCGFSLQMN